MMIIDDFLENAEALRDAALRLDYPENAAAFPGRNSRQRINIDGLVEGCSQFLGEPLRPIEPRQSHAKCRITLAGDVGRASVHVDSAHWSGILYLSRPEDCRGGTEFFRHKPTGMDRAPLNDAEAHAHGYPSGPEMTQAILEKDTLDPDQWEMTMRVPMRFNRLALLRPWLWHTAGEAFGDSLENGRLIYLMFFESATRR
ncbi:DUF6445 family protein [Sphingomonas sp. CJ99]